MLWDAYERTDTLNGKLLLCERAEGKFYFETVNIIDITFGKTKVTKSVGILVSSGLILFK